MWLKRILRALGVIALTAVGVHVAAVQAASARTPSASITCTSWAIGAQSYETNDNNIYTHSVDGVTAVSSGATYSVAFAFVYGIKSAASTQPATDGTGVTVTTQAQDGYALTGTTSWSHEFSAKPTCDQAAAVQIVGLPADQSPAAPARVGLASTGVPTTDILLLGGLFALGVAAMCIGGIDRRWFRRNRH